jgi:RHS repeat-associated protein
MMMPGRSFSVGNQYRYGFNGKEKDSDINSGAIAFEARIFDSRLGRFLSTDSREFDYAWQSTFIYFRNSPISVIDFKGEGGGDDKKPKKVKAGSNGKVNVSFHSASDAIGTCDAVGGDDDKNNKDNCLTNFNTAHDKVVDPTFKTFAVSKLSDVKSQLRKLKKEGYEIGTVILNAHADLSGGFWLGGKQNISNFENILKGNLGENSIVILNMCNIGAGRDPNSRASELLNLSQSIGKVVYASMSFGTGRPDMFNTGGTKDPMSTELGVDQYKPGGGHFDYPDNTILYQNCYLQVWPKLSLTNHFRIVSNLVVNASGNGYYNTSNAAQLEKNKKLLEQAQKGGRVASNPNPVRTDNLKTN